MKLTTDTEKLIELAKADMDRFFSKIGKLKKPISKFVKTGCWLWKDALDSGGYPRFYLNGIHFGAHRLSFQIHKGELTENMDCCHRCDVRHCVNPAHLFLGTRIQNMRDWARKGKNGIRRGSKLAATYSSANTGLFIGIEQRDAKLTDAIVRKCRELYDKGIKTKELAKRYNVNDFTMYRAIYRKTWRHVK